MIHRVILQSVQDNKTAAALRFSLSLSLVLKCVMQLINYDILSFPKPLEIKVVKQFRFEVTSLPIQVEKKPPRLI